MRTEGVSRTEDRVVVVVAKGGFPDAEVEVVDGQDEVLKEGGTLKCDYWTVAAFAFVDLAYVFCEFSCLLSTAGSRRWLDAPVHLDEITFV